MSSPAPQLEITWTAPPAAEEWNPRFLAFARVHGRTPTEQLAHDAERWPGGRMAGFILWIDDQWQTWRTKATATDGRRRHHADPAMPDDHADLDARLAELGPCDGCQACAPTS